DCAGSLPVNVSGRVDVSTPDEYTLTYTATDPDGNAASITRVVRVACGGPTITCPQNMIVTSDPGQCSAILQYSVAASPGASVVCQPPSGSAFPLGTTTISCTATDAAGQRAACEFAVTIVDKEQPRITRLSANP